MASCPGVTEVAHALTFLPSGGKPVKRRAVAVGVPPSAVGLIAAALGRATGRHTMLIVPHIDECDEYLDELDSAGVPAFGLPVLEAASGEVGISVELFAQRLAAVKDATLLASPHVPPTVIVAPFAALMQLVPAPAKASEFMRTLERGGRVKLHELLSWLSGAGYKRLDAIEEPGDFAVRGGIVDIFPGASPPGRSGKDVSVGTPVRLDFFGDEIDKITEIDLESMGSDRSVKRVELYIVDAARANERIEQDGVHFLELLPKECNICLAETMELIEQGRGYFERIVDSKGVVGPPAVLKLVDARFENIIELNQFSAGAIAADTRVDAGIATLPGFPRDSGEAIDELLMLSGAASADEQGASLPANVSKVIVCCQTQGELDRLRELLAGKDPRGSITSLVHYLHRGSVVPGEGERVTTLVPYHELMGKFMVRRRGGARGEGSKEGGREGKLKSSRAMDTFLDFTSGDYVVHVDHGIAKFVGLTVMKPREVPAYQRALLAAGGSETGSAQPQVEEYLTLEFASQTKLHVPAVQIDKVQKYVGGFAGKPPLSTIGGVKWKNQKERVAESVRDLAGELLRVRAAREHMPGIRYSGDTAWQSEFEDEFPYDETPDQLAALSEIKKDMSSPRPMDRLICGDVGFGKTELAIRAAFKACEFGKQVAVVVPTTVLAEQHERTFRSRFAGYPFKVESLSRFKTDKEIKAILGELRKGRVDVIIGTHRLFSQDVDFSDLGLVVIDEEQRFGVEHKETLLRLRMTVDVMTLSATPIPRTLHMAMLGIRDISSLTTAPLDRRAIVTEVFPYNEKRIEMAIKREMAREGQVYFVHNRVSDIASIADNIRKLSPPGTRVIYGHGQMAPQQLEDVMLTFMRKKADILVATTIIEAGIDIPSANTMFINDADRFGLADLHQLRGRVGRSKHRAYCYLLLDPDKAVKEVAQKRLKAIEQFSMLGAGFKIAMRDLEIRGAGNILGPEQSGHIAAVGYEMYCHLLEQSVLDLKNEKRPDPPSATALELGIGGLLPKAYIPSEARRLEAYRRLCVAADFTQLDQLYSDLCDAYGSPPAGSMRLFELAQIRIALAKLRVRTCTVRERDLVFLAHDPQPIAEQLRATAPSANTVATTVRVLAPNEATGTTLSEVYLRLPDGAFEATTLLAILRRRLGCPASKALEGRAPVEPGVAAGQGRPKDKRNIASTERQQGMKPEPPQAAPARNATKPPLDPSTIKAGAIPQRSSLGGLVSNKHPKRHDLPPGRL